MRPGSSDGLFGKAVQHTTQQGARPRVLHWLRGNRTQRLIVFFALAGLIHLLPGCGAQPLDPRFARTWSGTALELLGSAAFQNPMQIEVTVSEDSAVVAPFCPDPPGYPVKSIVMNGSGRSLHWSGAVRCSWGGVPDCEETVVPTFTSATVTLSQDGKTLQLLSSGSGEGCSRSWPASASFTGI